MKSVAIILTQPPFANSDGHDALDMAMVLGSFEIQAALFFTGNALNQLRDMAPARMAIKDYTRGFSALPFYDIEELYVCREDLEFWSIPANTLTEDFKLVDRHELNSKLQRYSRVIRF